MQNIRQKLSIGNKPIKGRTTIRQVVARYDWLPQFRPGARGNTTGRTSLSNRPTLLNLPLVIFNSSHIRGGGSARRAGGVKVCRASYATYALATILFLLSATFSLTLLRNKLTGAVTDTGSAEITSVGISKLGTGKTVTYDDGSTLTADTSKYEVLNNDEVVYKVAYNVTKAGTVALSITMPANNTINESSISIANGCMDGSKLEAVEVNGQKSYTNNKATCIVNHDTNNKTAAWAISTNPWGGTGAKITPIFAINDTTVSNLSIQPVTMVGKLKYKMYVNNSWVSQGVSDGYNRYTGLGFGLYSDIDAKTSLIGIEPIKDGDWQFDVDMSEYPAEWEVGTTIGNGGLNYLDAASLYVGSGGTIKFDKVDRDTLRITRSGTVSGTSTCARIDGVPSGCFYSVCAVQIIVPVSSLEPTLKDYSVKFPQFIVNGANSDSAVIPSATRLSFSLSNAGYGQASIYASDNLPIGWIHGWRNDEVMYAGEDMTFQLLASSNYAPQGTYTTNFNLCTSWDATMAVVSLLDQVNSDSTLSSSFTIDYGVMPVGNDGFADLSKGCGVAGQDFDDGRFFISKSEADQYATSIGKTVNVVRFHADKVKMGRDVPIGNLSVHINGDKQSYNSHKMFKFVLTTDQYSQKSQHGDSSYDGSIKSYRLVSGLITPSLSAIPSDTAPNTEDHITITPRTYNQETNAQIGVAMPDGLTAKQGTFYRDANSNDTMDDGEELIEGRDYSLNDNLITFNLGTIGNQPTTGSDGLPVASDGDKDSDGFPTGVPQPAIHFDTLIDGSVPTPSTLTITAKTTGDGTKYASDSFRTSTAKVNVAVREEFGYNLTTNANTIYASDDLTYDLSNYNMLDKDVNNLTTINVLPYNGDSRGTLGLNSYNLDNITLTAKGQNNTEIDTSDLKLQYTTDVSVRENPNDSNVQWQEISSEALNHPDENAAEFLSALSGQGGTNQPTAFKITKATMPKGSIINLSYTMTNIDMDEPTNTTKPTIGNDITYISSTALDNPVANVARTETKYLGNLLTLSLDKDNLTIDKLNTQTLDETSLTNTVTATTKTKSGYNLTINPATESSDGTTTSLLGTKTGSNGKKLELPTLAVGQTLNKNTAAWAVKGGNLANWTGFTNPAQSLTLHTNTVGGAETVPIPTTFAISSGNVRADTYRGAVRYTLTAEL